MAPSGATAISTLRKGDRVRVTWDSGKHHGIVVDKRELLNRRNRTVHYAQVKYENGQRLWVDDEFSGAWEVQRLASADAEALAQSGKRTRSGKTRAEPETKPEAEPETEQAKKLRSVCKAMDESADELLCPITQELPIDPVTAEDGRVYERSAIEEWLKTNEKSPHTNEPMGTKLLPALQVKNMIAKMVESGALSGDKCEAWTKKIEQEKMAADMRKKAEAGDVEAMMTMSAWYDGGENGLAEDESMAFYWMKRAADLDDPIALVGLSYCYLVGSGTEKDLNQYAVKLTQAAMLGCINAMCMLVRNYHRGRPEFNFKKSASDALYWAKKVNSLPESPTKTRWMASWGGACVKAVLGTSRVR